MKRYLALLCILCALLLVACQPSNTQNPDENNNSQSSEQTPNENNNPQSSEQTPNENNNPQSPEQNPGTNEELATYNTLFGNLGSWYNKALLCQYDSPAQLKLELLFYSGFTGESQTPTDAEWAELKDQPGFDSNYDLIRLPVDKMNQVLTDYFGITLDEIDDAGFENLVYLESTNCYYHMVTDANAVENFQATAVQTQEDGSIRMSYTAGSNNTAFVATLMPNGDGYQILSNEQA